MSKLALERESFDVAPNANSTNGTVFITGLYGQRWDDRGRVRHPLYSYVVDTPATQQGQSGLGTAQSLVDNPFTYRRRSESGIDNGGDDA